MKKALPEDAPKPGAFKEPGAETPATEEAPASEVTTNLVDDIQLIDGIGDKTAEKLRDAGYGTLTSIADLTADQITELEQKIEISEGTFEKQEWQVQAREMIAGGEPRSQTDKDLRKKLLAQRDAGGKANEGEAS
ncbi:MAG: helix-hairpin-helix domain-containing protein [Pseudomonadota bacterium]